jgi:hypothetical protein
MRTQLYSIVEFKKEFELFTGIVRYVVENKDSFYLLHALNQDANKVKAFIHANQVNIQTNFCDELNTNGGIKNVV